MHPNAYLQTLWSTAKRPIVFVAMSFGTEYDSRFVNVFIPSIESIPLNGTHLQALRVDESKSGDSILTEIMEGIALSTLVLADVSTMGHDSKTGAPYRNGNVMYEVGIALACRQPSEVLLVRDDHDKFMFDVSSIPHMTIDFADTEAAIHQIKQSLKDRLLETSFINDARVSIATSRIGPTELRILKDISSKKTSFQMKVGDTNAYARLLDMGIVNLVLDRPYIDDMPNYDITAFGRAVMTLLFKDDDV